MPYTLDDAYNAKYALNLAEAIDSPMLESLGRTICEFVDEDEGSRQEWISSHQEWLKLATQVRETKSYPWDSASNVKYPLMTIACMQFHARALPGLLPNDRPVKAKIIGDDPQYKKARRGERVSKFMSYQVLEDMEEWVDDLDRLLLVLPMIGLVYKKTYYSADEDRLKSSLLLPEECIVNYHANSYDRARITHKLMMDSNEVVELQRSGVFLDIDLGEPQERNQNKTRDESQGFTRGNSKDDPYEILEVHYWWDLDQDGYKEPYIITVDRDSEKVLRIVPRWLSEESVIKNDSGEIAKILADNYFTAYRFIPDPNSSVYGIGLGTLLGPTNEAVNTLINQLIDAGTLSNMQGGFIGRGAKLKGGATRFRPGEWKIVNTPGDDLRKSIVPVPANDPSSTLFNLLSFLVSAGERVSAVSDMMVGETPGQNTPATTSMAALEQGLKVFNSIYKRVHRSLQKEFKLIYKLNYETLDEEYYKSVLDTDIDMSQFGLNVPSPEQLAEIKQALEAENRLATLEDFNPEGINILPASDPNMVSDSMKILKSQDLIQKLASGLPLNPAVVTKKSLEAAGHDDVVELMTIPPAPPSIEQKEFDLEVMKEQREAINSYFDNLLKVAQAEGEEEGRQLETYRAIVEDNLKVAEAKRAENEPQQGANSNNQAAS